jgi:hypothetical protein
MLIRLWGPAAEHLINTQEARRLCNGHSSPEHTRSRLFSELADDQTNRWLWLPRAANHMDEVGPSMVFGLFLWDFRSIYPLQCRLLCLRATVVLRIPFLQWWAIQHMWGPSPEFQLNVLRNLSLPISALCTVVVWLWLQLMHKAALRERTPHGVSVTCKYPCCYHPKEMRI